MKYCCWVLLILVGFAALWSCREARRTLLGLSCGTDAECGEHICDEGVCTIRTGCVWDEDCPDGKLCITNACRSCVTDDDCVRTNSGDRCVSGGCMRTGQAEEDAADAREDVTDLRDVPDTARDRVDTHEVEPPDTRPQDLPPDKVSDTATPDTRDTAAPDTRDTSVEDTAAPDTRDTSVEDTATPDTRDTAQQDTSADTEPVGCLTTAECDDHNNCTEELCLPDTHECLVWVNPYNPCSDDNPCTEDDKCTEEGKCKGTLIMDCDDGDDCTDDLCEPDAGTCLHWLDVMNTCSDDDPCTENDECLDTGECVGIPRDCDDGRDCSIDWCDSESGDCLHDLSDCACLEGADCDDYNPCTDDSCEVTSGQCVNDINTSNSCDDDSLCTEDDECQTDGTCQGTPVDCSSLTDQCNVGSCDPTDGSCFKDPVSGGCSDGSACTTNDTCLAGVCSGGPPPNCNDNNVCTTDSCNSAFGCVNSNNSQPCNDNNVCTTGDTCSGGICVGGPDLDCNDYKVCTTDYCQHPTGCVNENNFEPCTDNDECTVGDTCSGGSCIPGPPADCNDNEVCTDDGCDPATGCTWTNNSARCGICQRCDPTDGSCSVTPGSDSACLFVNCPPDNLPCADYPPDYGQACKPIGECYTAADCTANADFAGPGMPCGECHMCDGSGGCDPLTGSNGPYCAEVCSYCSSGNCLTRSNGDQAECTEECSECNGSDRSACYHTYTGQEGVSCTGSTSFCCLGRCLYPGGELGGSCGELACIGSWRCTTGGAACDDEDGLVCMECLDGSDQMIEGRCQNGTCNTNLPGEIWQCSACLFCVTNYNHTMECLGTIRKCQEDTTLPYLCNQADACDGAGNCMNKVDLDCP